LHGLQVVQHFALHQQQGHKEYLTNTYYLELVTVLEALANQSIKSISNKDFMLQITNLLYIISGQDNMVKEGEEHKVEQAGKRAADNPLFSVKLPPA
jgi:hypothetical protein